MFTDLRMLNHLCISRIKPTWSWLMVLWCLEFSLQVLYQFCIYVQKKIGLQFSFFSFYAFGYQLNCKLIKKIGQYSFIFYFVKLFNDFFSLIIWKSCRVLCKTISALVFLLDNFFKKLLIFHYGLYMSFKIVYRILI